MSLDSGKSYEIAPTLCRDCAEAVTGASCASCGGTRTLAHAELLDLGIAHVDCDAFYASVEKRDDPALRDVPVAVGGGRRGVVSAACYHARIYGVRSAMPMFEALRRCPQLTVVRGDMAKYAREGRRIRELMGELTPLVEPLSIDEAFLDLTGTARLHGRAPAQSLIRLQRRILDEVGVTVSVGLSFNKFLAKTASDLDKPNGFAVLGRGDAQAFLDPQPVGFVYGIGPAFAAKLERAGLRTIADVRTWSDRRLAERFGDNGLRLARLARGEDHRRVNPASTRKSVSAETTFSEDIGDVEALKDKLWQVCLKTSDRSKAKDLAGTVVTLKLKTARFKSFTRRRTMAAPVQLADALFRALEPLLEAEVRANPHQTYRLIGAGIGGLCKPGADGGDLLDPMAEKRGRAERARDAARAKFGTDAVLTGRGLRLAQAKDSSATSLPGKIRDDQL